MNSRPKAWLLFSEKGGDNKQVAFVADIVASQLGWKVEPKQLHFPPPWDQKKPKVVPTLRYLDKQSQEALGPPWPEFIITAGRRPACVALWVKKESKKTTKVINIARFPQLNFKNISYIFDLVISNKAYCLPPHDNVLMLSLPLGSVDHDLIRQARSYWSERFASAPRPLVGILIGGKTRHYAFGKDTLEVILSCADQVRKIGATPCFQ